MGWQTGKGSKTWVQFVWKERKKNLEAWAIQFSHDLKVFQIAQALYLCIPF